MLNQVKASTASPLSPGRSSVPSMCRLISLARLRRSTRSRWLGLIRPLRPICTTTACPRDAFETRRWQRHRDSRRVLPIAGSETGRHDQSANNRRRRKIADCWIAPRRASVGNEQILITLQQAQKLLDMPGRINVIEANLTTKDKAQTEAYRQQYQSATGKELYARRIDERFGICRRDASGRFDL